MLLSNNSNAIALQAKLFRGFADPSRLALLEALKDGPLTVTQLVAQTGLSQSNTSNHLACLMDCGLITRTTQGRFAHYALSDPRVAQLLGLADALLTEVARGVYECVHYQIPLDKLEGEN